MQGVSIVDGFAKAQSLHVRWIQANALLSLRPFFIDAAQERIAESCLICDLRSKLVPACAFEESGLELKDDWL